MTEALLLVPALLLTFACGLFVAAEFSLTTVERAALERSAERGEPGAAAALGAVRTLTLQLSGAQLGITATGLVIGMLAKSSIAGLLRGPLRAAGLPEGSASSLALVLGTAVSTVALMVIGELVPKNWAIARPLPVARAVAPPQRVFTAAFGPLIRHLDNTANRVLRRFGMEPAEELATARGPRELAALARHSAKQGALEADTAELFVRTLGLGDLTAQNVMTPRVQVTALEAHATAEDVANATRATGLSRFPVYRDSLDAVIGTVHVKDVLAVPAADRPRLPVDRVMERLSGRKTMAVVIDEYGGTAGVITLEDIVEEVVGEVRDEHDPQELPDLLFLREDGQGRRIYDADGATRTEDQLERVGLHVPEGPYETLAGLVAQRLGRIPELGDVVELDGWRIEVTEASGHRAARARLLSPPRAPQEDAAGGGAGGVR
jgi:CBS domain containing-hemolysin-like protein